MILSRFFSSIIIFFIYRVGGETQDMRIFALPPIVAPHSITCRACERDPFCVMSVSFRRLQFRAFAIPFTPLKVRRPILLPVILSYYRITLFDYSTRSVSFISSVLYYPSMPLYYSSFPFSYFMILLEYYFILLVGYPIIILLYSSMILLCLYFYYYFTYLHYSSIISLWFHDFLSVIRSYYKIIVFDYYTRSVCSILLLFYYPINATVIFYHSILLLCDFIRVFFYFIFQLSNCYITLFF